MFQLLQKLVLQALVQVQVRVQVRALAPAQVVVGVVVVVAAGAVERESAQEYAWEEREAVPALELVVSC